MTTMWYEDDVLFTADIQAVAAGQDFLHGEDLDEEHFKTETVKAQMSNVTSCLGSKRPKDKKGVEARERNLNAWTEMITLAVALTGLPAAACALPVDVDTVRKYQLENKDWKLPPYKNTDNGTLMKHFVDNLEENYKKYCDVDEAEFYRLNPGGKYLPKTKFDDIKPLLCEILRYCIKFWYLNPWLSRENAHADAIEHLRKEYKWNNSPKQIIDSLLAARVDAILKKQLFALKTEAKPGSTTGELVFSENEDAALLITKFLKAEHWKLNKNNLDPIMDLKDCFEAFTDEAEKLEWKNKFDKVVPKETAAYLEKVNKAKEAEKKVQEKKEKQAAQEAARLEKKRKALEESIAAAPTGRTKGRAARSATDADTLKEMADKDPFWDCKLKIGDWEIVEQDAPDTTNVRAAKRQAKDLKVAGIQKCIMGVVTSCGKATIEVNYKKPGAEWLNTFLWRYNNLIHALGIFGASELGQDIVEACVENKESLSITKTSARVVLATMLHTSCKSDKDWPKLGVHANFSESVFLVDLKNTKKLWLPSCIAGSIVTLHGFYRLACVADVMAGEGQDDRIKSLLEYVAEKESVEKAKQVQEIIAVLQSIDEEIDGTAAYGEKELPIDPFDTVSLIGADKE